MAPFPRDVASAPDPASVPSLPAAAIPYTAFERVERLGESPGTIVSEALVSVDGSGHRVALTELREKASPTGREFVAAARDWDRVTDHDHVADVLDWGKKPRPWIATERLPGGSLADRVGDVSVDHACWIGVCVAAALRYAHDADIVHAALTPGSIRFQPTAVAWDFPKVTDWGIGRLLGPANQPWELGEAAGYRAPEQVDERLGPVDERTDVYRLGVVLYELLTGELPYLDPSVPDAIVGAVPVPPTTVDPSLPPATDDLLLGALEKDPEDRYQSVVAFRGDLVRLLDAVHDGDDGGGRDDLVEAVTGDLDVSLQTFPMFDGDRAEWTATCPACGRSINNTLSSFAAHWTESDHCPGAPESPPPGRSSHSDEEWTAVLAVVDAAQDRHDDRSTGTSDPDHPLWAALAVDGTTVVEVGGVPVETRDGTFPWLDYPRHGWRVPCPACDETVFNAKSALMDHWAAARRCDGPPDDFRTV